MAKKRKVHSLTGRIDDRLMMQAFKAVNLLELREDENRKLREGL